MPLSSYPALLLKPGREVALVKGHPWLFSGAVAKAIGDPEPGQVVVVKSAEGHPLALGFANPGTDIIFRRLSDDVTSPIDGHFWQRRLRSALALRRRVVPPETTAYRLVNAEGDGIPGLIVDRYGDCCVVTFATAGAERCRGAILDALTQEISPAGIYERSDGGARRQEGLDDRLGVVAGEVPERVEILEHGLRYEVDLVRGQKTGFFLDQRDNRALIRRISAQAEVLNCFSYTGGFSVNAARGGAHRVVSVEASAEANAAAARHFAMNGLDPADHPVVQADCFAYLRAGDETFDVIILDPPAFAKGRKDVQRAARGYKDINLQAMKRLRRHGILATFSCSNAIEEDLFEKIVAGAARDAGRSFRILARLGPGADHPTALSHQEGRYLKGLLLNLID